jgi:catechol 2,3-dioxygenase-like lactoylglutathione lyase family enzyme
MKYSVEHLALAANDPAALKDWYLQVLGGEEVFDNGQTPPAYLLRLPGGLMIEIYKCQSAIKQTSDNTLAGWRHLALRVDSIQQAKADLSERGVVFTEPIRPAGGGGRVLFFKDREGNLLHLVERDGKLG